MGGEASAGPLFPSRRCDACHSIREHFVPHEVLFILCPPVVHRFFILQSCDRQHDGNAHLTDNFPKQPPVLDAGFFDSRSSHAKDEETDTSIQPAKQGIQLRIV